MSDLTLTIRTILAGVGFLLFALHLLEEGFSYYSKSMSTLLRRFTKYNWSAILTGSASTALLQSSSVTSLITLALVGSGVLGLQQAIGVILGANIGTTLTDSLIGFIGISEGGFDLKAFTMPAIALGGIGMILFKKRKHFFLVVISFGLLLYSLDVIKLGVSDIKDMIDLTWIVGANYFAVFLFGLAVALIIQSSGATSLLTMTAVSQGLFGFQEGIAMIIGAYLGTTITIVIGALGGSASKKQVAATHVGFNILFCTVCLILFKPIIYVLGEIVGPQLLGGPITTSSEKVQVIILFHMFGKFTGVLLFYPFISWWTAFVQKLIPVQQKVLGLRFESRNENLSSSVKAELLIADIQDYKERVHDYIESVIKYPAEEYAEKHNLLATQSSYLIKAVTMVEDRTSTTVHHYTDYIQHLLYASNDITAVKSYLEILSLSEDEALSAYNDQLLKSFHDINLRSLSKEKQKSLLQEVLTADNTIIEHNDLNTDQITMLSSINHGFYLSCKNLLRSKS